MERFGYTEIMATRNPRINTVLEPPLFEAVETLAKRDRVSLSQKVRDLLREALELVEDEGLEAIAHSRRKGKWISHAEVKRQLEAQ